jgi:type IV pilus assembly protein PilA
MLRKLTDRDDGDRGFSLIELVVVVLIVAILAAIAIPFFISQRTRSYEAQTQATLRDSATAMKSYATKNDGAYPAPGDEAQLVAEGFRPTSGAPVLIKTGGTDYCLEVDHDNLPGAWNYQATEGKPLSGACPP